MTDIPNWLTTACAIYVLIGVVVALVCAVGLALDREWRWIPFGAFVGGSLWPLTLAAWSIEMRDWWERRSEVQPVEAWDDTTLVSACDEPTIVERPPWADESRVSAAAKLGGRRR